MYCINCGHQISGEMKYCPNCGHQITTDDNRMSNELVASNKASKYNPPETTETEQDKPKSGLLWVAFFVCAIFITAFAAVICSLSELSNTPTKASTTGSSQAMTSQTTQNHSIQQEPVQKRRITPEWRYPVADNGTTSAVVDGVNGDDTSASADWVLMVYPYGNVGHFIMVKNKYNKLQQGGIPVIEITTTSGYHKKYKVRDIDKCSERDANLDSNGVPNNIAFLNPNDNGSYCIYDKKLIKQMTDSENTSMSFPLASGHKATAVFKTYGLKLSKVSN